MDRSNVCLLISVEMTKDEIGQNIPTEKAKKVFCGVKSVNSEEWFAANREGMNAKFKISMFAYDYAGEKIVELEGVRYCVYRTYRAQNDDIELYLEEKVGTTYE